MPVTPTRPACCWTIPVLILLLAGTTTQSRASLAQDIEAITGNRTKIVWAKAVGSTCESDATSSNYVLMRYRDGALLVQIYKWRSVPHSP